MPRPRSGQDEVVKSTKQGSSQHRHRQGEKRKMPLDELERPVSQRNTKISKHSVSNGSKLRDQKKPSSRDDRVKPAPVRPRSTDENAQSRNSRPISKDDNLKSRSNTKKPSLDEESLSSSFIKTTPLELEENESPIIRKNKEMRNRKSKERRSSLSNRGKRLTSIGQNSMAVPHSDISPHDYYKHLDINVSSADRMRQLLLWCAKRQLELSNKQLRARPDNLASSGGKQSSDELTAINISKSIQKELVKDLSEGKISTSWQSRPEKPQYLTGNLKPNAHNVANMENYKTFEKRLKELEKEKREWEAQLERIERFREFDQSLMESELLEAAKGAKIESSTSISSIIGGLSGLESTLNRLEDQVSKIEGMERVSYRYIARQQGKLAGLVREQRVQEKTEFSAHDVLRALSRCE